jgi:hypothetical protein
MQINHLADWSDEEYASLLGLHQNDDQSNSSSLKYFEHSGKPPLPVIDWRDR